MGHGLPRSLVGPQQQGEMVESRQEEIRPKSGQIVIPNQEDLHQLLFHLPPGFAGLSPRFFTGNHEAGPAAGKRQGVTQEPYQLLGTLRIWVPAATIGMKDVPERVNHKIQHGVMGLFQTAYGQRIDVRPTPPTMTPPANRFLDPSSGGNSPRGRLNAGWGKPRIPREIPL
jgi:hypothetical protein